MLKQLSQFICVIFILLYVKLVHANEDDITLKELVLGGQEDFHLRILKAINQLKIALIIIIQR